MANPFLPDLLAETLEQRRLPYRMTRPAGLLFTDISGFTALTERLSERGRRGAEEIADVISKAFQPAVSSIRRRGGSIVSFGGDALFSVFVGSGGSERAVAAAESIRERIARMTLKTTQGAVRLEVSQAVHAGTVHCVHLESDPERHFLVTGPSVRKLARLQDSTNAGEIAVSRAAQATPLTGDQLRRRRSPAVDTASYVPSRLRPVLGRGDYGYKVAAVLFFETRGDSLTALQRFYRSLSTRLAHHQGVLLKTDLSATGTKWMCVFGLPSVLGDEIDRAALAALEVTGAVPRGITMRGGLHYGNLVNVEIGSSARRSYEVMGDVVNTAARALSCAPWGTIAIDETATATLARVSTTALGSFSVKGLRRPLQLRTLKERRHEQRIARSRSPLVGRAREMRQLKEALARGRRGYGAAVSIEAAAGAGKSRLAWEVAQTADDFDVARGGTARYGSRPYQAIGSLLRGLLEVPVDASAGQVRSILKRRAPGLPRIDRHHLADVLGSRDPRSPLRYLEPRAIRENNLLAVASLLRARSRDRPQLWILEDLHWADGATIDGIASLSRIVASHPAVLLLLHRRGYDPPPRAERIFLERLESRAVSAMIRNMLGPVPAAVRTLVEGRAEGNPFFVEELVRRLLDTGFLVRRGRGLELVREPDAEDLPASIEALLESRLDRLPPAAKRVTQQASVVGRRAELDALSAIAERPDSLERHLGEIVSQSIMFSTPAPRPAWVFSHALTRDVAYASALVAARRSWHRSLARWMDGARGARRTPNIALIAHHWEQAGDRRRARARYLEAARAAVKSHALKDAEVFYGKHLNLTRRSDRTGRRARLELARQVLNVRGETKAAAQQIEEALREATEASDGAAQAHAWWSMGLNLMVRSRLEEASQANRTALQLARRHQDRGVELQALQLAGQLAERRGDLDAGERRLRRALRVSRRQRDRRLQGSILTSLAIVLQRRGRLDEAERLNRQSLHIAEQSEQPRAAAYALSNLAATHYFMGRVDDCRRSLQRALGIARKIGDRRAVGTLLGNLGVLHRETGSLEDARRAQKEALAIALETESEASAGAALTNLSNLARDEGRLDEAAQLLERVIDKWHGLGLRHREASARTELGQLLIRRGRFRPAREQLEAARSLHRGLANPEERVRTLIGLAQLERLQSGNLDNAERRIRRAQAVLAKVQAPRARIELLCEKGALRIAQGLDPAATLGRCRRLAAESGLPREHSLWDQLRELERAADRR